MPVAIAITTMSGSVSQKVSPVTEKKETVFAAKQPGKHLGSREIKPGKIGQVEEWNRMIPVPFFPINQVNIPLASGLQSVNSLFTLPGPKAQSPGTITSRRQSRFLDQRRAGDRRACSLLPTLTKNFDRGKRPKSPLRGEGTRNPTSQPPEGVAACKGGGASDQETIGPAPSKTKGERCARKEGGGNQLKLT